MRGKDIRFGIIGCGGIANTHAEALLTIKGAKLIGVCGGTPEEPKEFAAKYGIKSYSSTDELLESDDIDAVCICTPSGLHASIAINAAKHKKNAIIEKPLALTKESAMNIITAFRVNDVTGSVISQLRFSTDIREAREMIRSGKLGNIIMANLVMKYSRSQAYYDQGNWRGTWKLDGGGALMNQGIHGVDMLLFLLGEVKNAHGYIRTLTHKIEVEDNVAAILIFKSGALGTIIASTSMNPAKNKYIEIHGEKGTIIIEEDRIRNIYIEGEKEYICDVQAAESATNHLVKAKGHIQQLQDFTDALQEHRAPYVTLEDGMRAVDLITTIYGSSKTNTIYHR
jgi:predicted dehydrogenase